MANCIRCGRQLPGFSFGKKICQWCVQHEASQRGEVVRDAPQPVMRTPWVRRGESTIGLTQIIFGINAAVFVGMAIGRPGCFFAGCCSGRPTVSRWGLWSSDRRIGIRRIPIQLIEAAAALLIGVTALSLTLANGGYLLPFVLDPTIILTNSASANPWRRISRNVTTTSSTWNGVNSAGVTARGAGDTGIGKLGRFITQSGML